MLTLATEPAKIGELTLQLPLLGYNALSDPMVESLLDIFCYFGGGGATGERAAIEIAMGGVGQRKGVRAVGQVFAPRCFQP